MKRWFSAMYKVHPLLPVAIGLGLVISVLGLCDQTFENAMLSTVVMYLTIPVGTAFLVIAFGLLAVMEVDESPASKRGNSPPTSR